MEDLKLQYRNLEQRVIWDLRRKVENSTNTSKYVDEKAISVDVYDYVELTIVNDHLTFINSNGLHYSLFASQCNLEDWIDILIAE